MTFADALGIIKDAVENPKFQTIQLIINQNVSISGYISKWQLLPWQL